jgi:hypothetical protein
MRRESREALRRRFDYRCAYCGVSESHVGAELTVDHFQPSSRGGTDDPANLVYSCFTCNNLKADLWAPDAPERILHPLSDDLSTHLAEQPDGTLVGLTETGCFHIQQLQLNRGPLIAHRRERRRSEELVQTLETVVRQQAALRQRIEALEQALAEAERRLRSF